MKLEPRLFAIFFVATACAANGFPADAVAAMRGSIADLRAENEAHQAAVAAAASPESILAVENDHGLRIAEDFRAIRSTLDRLSVSCILGNRYPIDTGPMHDAMLDVRLEYEEHDIRMRTSADRTAMLSEEDRYSGAMRGALGELEARMNDLLEHESDVENCK